MAESMVRVPARGLSNVAFPLRVAKCESALVPARDARVLLLSDCVQDRLTCTHRDAAPPSAHCSPS